MRQQATSEMGREGLEGSVRSIWITIPFLHAVVGVCERRMGLPSAMVDQFNQTEDVRRRSFELDLESSAMGTLPAAAIKPE
jgi:hypothetical protein